MKKFDAITLFQNAGVKIATNVTFASESKSKIKRYWANPNKDFLNYDWTLIFNDIDNQEIHCFNIPANTFTTSILAPRIDKPELLELKFAYGDPNFTETYSKVQIGQYLVKSLTY